MIALVKSEFNSEITNLLEKGCIDYLTKKNTPFVVYTCPGAVETVSYCTNLLHKNRYKAIVVIGAIIKGDTDHYEYVCQYVTQGFSTLAATNNTPVIFGILTTQTEELAYERAALDRMNKGAEFAETALFMIDAYQKL